MRSLVLGSEGQIGYALCDYLRGNGHDVVEFDIVNSITQDLRIEGALRSIIQEIDFVFFLAFDVGGSRYLNKYQTTYEFLENNTKLMLYTFEMLRRYDVPFIFTSSQMSNMSYSPYGVLKSLGELYTKSLGGLVVKFWNVYGPERDYEKSHVITYFVLKAKSGNDIDMLTDGKESRQFLHVDDCSRCLDIISKQYSNIPREQELHITSYEWSTILEVAEIVADHYGVGIIPGASSDMVQRDLKNEANDFILNYWNPEITLREGIERVIHSIEVGVG